MRQKQNKFTLFFLLITVAFYGQMQNYDAKIELKNIKDTWHTITLPDVVFSNTQERLSDIRIYGITAKNDTIEAPYLLNYTSPKLKTKTVDYKLLNASTKDGVYYFTLKVPSKDAINHIKLNFENSNFDWKVLVEASHHQKKWFKIYDDYRIVAIKNSQTNYSFTDITFPAAEFSYFRIGIKSDEEPILEKATLEHQQQTAANITDRTVKSFNVVEDKKNKKTIVNIAFDRKAPTHQITVKVNNKIDYYRPIKIEELIDSVKTEKGYVYNYNTLRIGTLSSIENNAFTFDNTFSKKIRVTILNFDNQPLKIDNINAKGYKYQLTARFTEPATYYLTYGNKSAYAPNYDIAQLNIKMPEDIKGLTLGSVTEIAKKEEKIQEPLFTNKIWLWLIMGIVMLVIGWFSYKMLSKKPE
ncbi:MULTISPECIES: DUF3999 family protein [unclassified Cellulophaga]|uniref:DUF3999 family protein n=1 Tax=unclassified Cellulophaga TaxID=2634405 RepID=UPI0026E29402|nr:MULTISPECIES: DUF3999 family protein [unclassified Cellulophaga]MDO6492655.1 DUF3999 family protein [Cellulophaga sp. 2_MG-2023]MDO6495912.1 DUF3999 family protein [Cellulophaga sp. 3_MG-2023]